MACGAGMIVSLVGAGEVPTTKVQCPAADDACSTAAPSPALTATCGKTPMWCSENSMPYAESLDSDSFALPEGEMSGSDSEEEGAAGVAMVQALRRYVLAGARPAATLQPDFRNDAEGQVLVEEEPSESGSEVLEFRLAVRRYAQRGSRRR